MLRVGILNLTGVALVDTGARHSITGSKLLDILLSRGIPYEDRVVSITLADGKLREVRAKQFELGVTIAGRVVKTNLLGITEHSQSRMLLGMNFIQKAGMVLDFSIRLQ